LENEIFLLIESIQISKIEIVVSRNAARQNAGAAIGRARVVKPVSAN
jgi:hypothetical protein